MSKQSRLPPRCPYQKKTTTHPIIDSTYPHHQKSRSQSFTLEEQPKWLDDLLSNDTEFSTTSKGTFHRRSASDSVTLLDGLNTLKYEEDSGSNEYCIGLESACMYGPNSPRRKGKLPFTENAIVSALSEYTSQKPMHQLDGVCVPPTSKFDSASEVNDEIKAEKRHTGQRSRVRKLQYIAELERTVDVFQAMESELSFKVGRLLQQRAALSMENTKLKQQLTKLQHQKLIVNGQYQSLRKEVERLKRRLTYSTNSKASTHFMSNAAATEAINSDIEWQMLNLGNLDLN